VKCLRVLSASQFLIYSCGFFFFVGDLDAQPQLGEVEMLKKETARLNDWDDEHPVRYQ